MKISIPNDAILAAMPHMAKKDVRYYLNGMCIEARPDGSAVVIGTNGHTLAAVHVVEAIEPEHRPDKPVQVIVPDSVLIAQKIAIRKTKGPIVLTIVKPAEDTKTAGTIPAQLTMTVDGTTTAFAGLKGTYPEWQRVIPRPTMTAEGGANPALSGAAGHFDFSLLALFAASAEVYRPRHTVAWSPVLLQNGPDAAAIVTIPSHPEFLGIFMPMRVSDSATNWIVPEWVGR